tara:strand:- start:5454 stop:6602 length:1149 start_codon:yes stop_codon:yes gene_type:complete
MIKFISRAQNYLEKIAKTRQPDSEVLAQSASWMRATTWCLMGTAVSGVAWLSIATTEEIVVAPGKLEPLGGVREIQIPLNGVIETLNVEEGERVTKGQLLLTLDPETSIQGIKTSNQSILLLREQLNLKEKELEKYLELNDAEQENLKRNFAVNTDILNRLELLVREGASSELQLLEQRNRVEEVRGRLEQTQVDRLRQTALLQQSVQQLRIRKAELENTLTEQTVRARYEQVFSPVDGIIFEMKPKGPGYVSRNNSAILKVVPFDQLEARVEIPSSDIGFVRVGQSADISIDSFPATDFGVLEGKVRRLGSDALNPDPQNPLYRYPADIELSNQKFTLKDGRVLPLQVGMSLTANIKLRKVSYLQLLLGSFRDKADSLREI